MERRRTVSGVRKRHLSIKVIVNSVMLGKKFLELIMKYIYMFIGHYM